MKNRPRITISKGAYMSETGMQTVQQEPFKAETFWFHIFRTMIDSGDAAKMGGTTFLVYAVIKAHVNFRSGLSFPGVETIARKAGISTDQVCRCVKTLEQMDYVQKKKVGRQNVYTLREKIQMTDRFGRSAAVATWDYLPSAVTHATKELQQYLDTGQHSGNIINIERLYIQINNNSGETLQFNLADIRDPELRDQLQSFYDVFVSKTKDVVAVR